MMRTRLWRVGLTVVIALSVAVVSADATVGRTTGTFAPTFSATTIGTDSTIHYSQAASDDPVGALTLLAPLTYVAQFGDLAGSTVGTAKATLQLADGGQTVQSSGTLATALPTTALTIGVTATTLGAAATACAGTATHTEYLLLTLPFAGQTLQIPGYFDTLQAGKGFGDQASSSLEFCFPPPDVPAGSPNRAPSGAKLITLDLKVTDEYSATPGWNLWYLKATPFAVGTGKLATSVEAQSLDRLPRTLTLVLRATGKRAQIVTGRLSEGGRGVGGQKIEILRGARVLARATTNGEGGYRATTRERGRGSLYATAAVAERNAGTCFASLLGVNCGGLTFGAYSLKSAPARLP